MQLPIKWRREGRILLEDVIVRKLTTLGRSHVACLWKEAMVFTPQNSNPSTHRNPWDPDPSRPDAVGGKNRVFCVCFGKPMLPSVEEELQQWMEDNHVSLLELKSFADRMLKEVAIIPFKVIK